MVLTIQPLVRCSPRYISKAISDALSANDRRILKISMIGAPNSGKSALFNQLIGTNVSAVSSREHTTRHRITGAATDKNTQLVFLDTPGLVPPWKMNKWLEKSTLMDPHNSLWEADIILAVHDASDPYRRHSLDTEVLRCLFAHSSIQNLSSGGKIDRFTNCYIS